MKPSQLIQAIDCSIDQRLPLFIWGAAGIGKSQIVQQVAAERKMSLCDIRAVLLDPVDLRGLPPHRRRQNRLDAARVPAHRWERDSLPR